MISRTKYRTFNYNVNDSLSTRNKLVTSPVAARFRRAICLINSSNGLLNESRLYLTVTGQRIAPFITDGRYRFNRIYSFLFYVTLWKLKYNWILRMGFLRRISKTRNVAFKSLWNLQKTSRNIIDYWVFHGLNRSEFYRQIIEQKIDFRNYLFIIAFYKRKYLLRKIINIWIIIFERGTSPFLFT